MCKSSTPNSLAASYQTLKILNTCTAYLNDLLSTERPFSTICKAENHYYYLFSAKKKFKGPLETIKSGECVY